MLTSAQLARAQQIVYSHMQATPALQWPQLCEHSGLDLWLKHENHTPIGAFKVRGGLVFAQGLADEKFSGKLVTATRGNHGQSIPFGARLHGMDVRVYVPCGNSTEKNAAMRHWGAELVEQGEDFDIARQAAEAWAAAHNARIVPSFHHDLVADVATYGAELFEQVANVDVVYVPIGMGSGACSLVQVRDLLGLSTEIVGVVSTQADAVQRSFAAGRIVTTDSARTFADGMATRMPNEEAFDIMYRGLARVVAVTDDEVAQAIRLLFSMTHNVAEGAGAAATAAVLKDRDQLRNKKVAVILSGGNIDAGWFASVLAGTTPQV